MGADQRGPDRGVLVARRLSRCWRPTPGSGAGRRPAPRSATSRARSGIASAHQPAAGQRGSRRPRRRRPRLERPRRRPVRPSRTDRARRSTSTASSQVVQAWSPARSSRDRHESLGPIGSTDGAAPAGTADDVDRGPAAPVVSGLQQALHASRAGSPTPASAAPGGPSTPNCQRTWFLPGAGAVGVEQVALVQHRVGDGRPRRCEASSRRRPAADPPTPASRRWSRVSQSGSPRARPVAGERVDGVPVAGAPTGCRGSARPSRPARPRPASGRRLAVPGHLLDGETGLPPGEHRAAEQQHQRHSPSRRACRYFAPDTSTS